MILSKECWGGCGVDSLPYCVGDVNWGWPHVRPWIEIEIVVFDCGCGCGVGLGSSGLGALEGGGLEEVGGRRLILRFSRTFFAIVSLMRAGEEGWSVIVTDWAPDRTEITDGRAVPSSFCFVSGLCCSAGCGCYCYCEEGGGGVWIEEGACGVEIGAAECA